MWQRLLGIVTIVLVLPLSVQGADDKKKKDAPAKDANVIDADKLTPGEFAGKLLSIPASNGNFTVEVETKHLEAKNGGQPHNTTAKPSTTNHNHPALNNLSKDIQNIARLQAQVQQARTPQEAAKSQQQLQQAMVQFERQAAQAQQQMAQAQQHAEMQVLKQLQQQVQGGGNVKVVTDKKTVEFHCGDDIPVRTLTLPLEYDEKGQPKKHSPEEVKKLKGTNPNLPGYEAKLEDLKPGTIVKVTLGLAAKPAPAKKEPAKNDADKKEADNKEADKKAAEKKDADKKDADKKAADKKDADKKDAGGIVENKNLVNRTVVKMIVIINSDNAVEPGSKADKKPKK